MGEAADKIKGHANEAIGKAKRALGEATNDPDLRAKGDLQKAKGAIKGALGDRV